MWKKAKKFAAFMLTAVLTVGILGNSTVAHAAPAVQDIVITDLASKTGERIDEENNGYEITLSVPGKVSEGYNEIILMIDASESQFKNLQKHINTTIKNIGDLVLNSNETVRLTLMHFGIAGGTIFSVDSKAELETELAGLDYDKLRRWPTATNCEAGFVHLQEHIANSPKLKNAFIVYTTDGNTNMSDEPQDYYDWWNAPEGFYKGKPEYDYTYIINTAFSNGLFKDVQMISELTKEMFPEVFAELESNFDITDSGINGIVRTSLLEAMSANDYAMGKTWLKEIWEEAFEGAGLDTDTSYPISTVEKAFVSVHGMESDAHFAFASAILDRTHTDDGYVGTRAAEACKTLAEMSKVEEIYLVDMVATSTRQWLTDVAAACDNVVLDEGTSNVLTKLEALCKEIARMPMNDAVVTDPMSKWVDLDPTSIRIYRDGQMIWNATEGWKVEKDAQPVDGDPITVTYDEARGKHTIEWKIKDGALLVSDNFEMKYNVTVDTDAEGFQFGKLYPANNTTYVDYTDENEEEQREGIVIPEVYAPGENADESEDLVLIMYKYTDTNTDIAGTGKEVDTEVLAGREPIEGIVFDIYKVATEEELDSGAAAWSKKPTREELALYETADRLAGTVRTNAAGVAKFNFTSFEQEAGLYLIVEREDVDRIQAPVDPFYLMIPMQDPENPGTVMKTVYVYPKNDLCEEQTPDGIINILKTNNQLIKSPLAGATFMLGRLPEDGELAEGTVTVGGEEVPVVWVPFYTDKECTGEAVTEVTTAEDGTAVMAGLEYGTYYLKETVAPSGYRLLQNAQVIQLSAYTTSNEVSVTIVNSPDFPWIPHTGGIGTTIFTIMGIALIAFAGAVFVISRRREE